MDHAGELIAFALKHPLNFAFVLATVAAGLTVGVATFDQPILGVPAVLIVVAFCSYLQLRANEYFRRWATERSNRDIKSRRD